MDANQLRAAFTGFFAARAHEVVPSAGLVPHDPRAPMFTNAGMNQFIPYYLGEEAAPFPRATSVQKCVRIRGKHDDIDLIGKTTRHLTFFEMLGNFSFGDYFKEGAIPYAWELLTEVLGLDGDALWVTVHTDDDEAVEIWTQVVGFPLARIQRLGADNFWEMGETGPCGPSSEIFIDRGPAWGPEGGPAAGSPERFSELWNLVFPQYDRQPDGTLAPLPKPAIDTGAGLERMLTILEDVPSVWETGTLRPIIALAEDLTERRYGADAEADVTLRVLADHARCSTALIADGVLPSNDGRGYVLRRVIRRAVLAARRLGVEGLVTPRLAAEAVAVLGEAYPNLRQELDGVQSVLEREETRFDRTVRTGLTLLEGALADASGAGALPGEVAFRLHDTHGFPIELTQELATEAGVEVDRAGFDRLMEEQRARARQSAKAPAAADEVAYRTLLDSEGPTSFVGRSSERYAVPARVIGVLGGAEPGTAEIFLDRTPFYAEGGGQLGDTGTIVTETGRAEVYDTVPGLPGLTAHRARMSGDMFVGQDALAAIDALRREDTRRNHTGTHLLHAALREVLGAHVRQQGSEVGPDRLRFDFSHHGALAPEELAAVAEMANADVLTDHRVETIETSRPEAERMGAIAFFEDKYGDLVRVVRAGPHSLEFCGGTHVDALGMIGPIAVVSEGSIGANTRRIFAVTGRASVERSLERERALEDAAALLKVEPEGVLDALGRLLDRQRAAERELTRLRSAAISGEADQLAAAAVDGVVAVRRDGRSSDELRALAQAVRQTDGVRGVVVGGVPEGGKVVIAVATGGQPDAGQVVKQVGSMVGGGGGGPPQVAVAGGRDASRLDEAIAEARRLLAAS